MIKEWFVILNPVANDGVGFAVWSKIEVVLKAHNFDFELAETKQKRHATTLTMQAIERGYRKILTIGGDGTLSEAVNGIFKQNKCAANAIISAHIPIGANNSWARHHKITRNFSVWIPLIKKLQPVPHDIGIVHYKLGDWKHHWYFMNMAACIYPGEVAWTFNEKSESVMNKTKMLSIILYNLLRFKRQALQLIHNNGEKVFTGKFYNCHVGICSYSAGLPMATHAQYNDGLLAVAHDKGKCNIWNIMQMMYKVFTQKVFKDKRVEISHVKKLEVQKTEKSSLVVCHVEADDEYLGEAPCRFEVMEKAWNVILPS